MSGKTSCLKKHKQEYDIMHLTFKCNLACIFCSNDPKSRAHRDPFLACVKKARNSPPKKVTLEGGEPTLDKRLPSFVERLRDGGAEEIVLATNGILFSNKDFTRRMLNTGITLFNVNFSSCNSAISELITGDRRALKRKIEGICNLLKLGGKNKTRLTFVINAINYAEMPGYIKFVSKEFPGLFYVAFNMIKVMGAVEKRTYLVPRLTKIAPYLLDALSISKKDNVDVITDGIPLCFMPGFANLSIDAHKKLVRGHSAIDQKYMPKACFSCGLNFKCGGLRQDYARLYGESEVHRQSDTP